MLFITHTKTFRFESVALCILPGSNQLLLAES